MTVLVFTFTQSGPDVIVAYRGTETETSTPIESEMCDRVLLKAAAKLVEFAEELWPDAGADKIKTDIEKLSEKIKKE